MKNKIKELLITSMKNKDVLARNILRYINSEIARKEKDTGKELDDNEIINIIKKEIKSIEENIQVAIAHGHNTNFCDERLKVAFLVSLLPKQLSKEEIKQAVDELFEENKYVNMGEAMKDIMLKLGAVADKRTISTLVKARF